MIPCQHMHVSAQPESLGLLPLVRMIGLFRSAHSKEGPVQLGMTSGVSSPSRCIRPRPMAALVAVMALLPLASGDAQTRAQPEDVGMSSERLARIVPAMQRYVDEKKLAGVVTLVARRGQLVHLEAIGSQNVAAGEAMTPDTIVRLMSLSKPITGAAVMSLYEEGHFLLTDPVSDYLPEFANMEVYLGDEDGRIMTEPAETITIRHLLTHTAGLTYDFFPTPVGRMYGEAGVVVSPPGKPTHASLDEWTQALATLPLIAQPGTDWNYSFGMDVLGRLIEVVSGKSFRAFLHERIFEPIDMRDTDFYVPAEKLSRFAACYVPTPDAGIALFDDPQTSPYRMLPPVEMGGSGLVGTAGDYLRFAQMLANGGELDGVRILSPTSVNLMMSDHMHPEMRPDPLTSLFGHPLYGGTGDDASRAWGFGYGLTGFVVTDSALTGVPLSTGSFGWVGAMTTHFWVDRQEDLIGIVLTQLLPDGTYPIRQLMEQMTYQAIID